MCTSMLLLLLHPMFCTSATLKYVRHGCFLCVFSYEIAQSVVNGQYFNIHPARGFFVCVCNGKCISIMLLRFPERSMCLESLMLLEISLCHKFGAFGNCWFYHTAAKRL